MLRDGHQVVVAAENLVPGDIVLLSMGDLVPADLRLLETHRLKAEESALTGESLPVEKDASLVFPSNTPLGDRKNMAYMGSSISLKAEELAWWWQQQWIPRWERSLT